MALHLIRALGLSWVTGSLASTLPSRLEYSPQDRSCRKGPRYKHRERCKCFNRPSCTLSILISTERQYGEHCTYLRHYETHWTTKLMVIKVPAICFQKGHFFAKSWEERHACQTVAGAVNERLQAYGFKYSRLYIA